MEDRRDMLSRLQLMASGNNKWDLSDNDQAAIAFVVNALEKATSELSAERARLDWLERRGLSTTSYATSDGRDYGVHSWMEPGTGQLMWTARYIGSAFASLRSAIDAARKGATKEFPVSKPLAEAESADAAKPENK